MNLARDYFAQHPEAVADLRKTLADVPSDATLTWEPTRPAVDVAAEYRERLPGALRLLVLWQERRAAVDWAIREGTVGPVAASEPLVLCPDPECRAEIASAVRGENGSLMFDGSITRQSGDRVVHQPWGATRRLKEQPWEAFDHYLQSPVGDWLADLTAASEQSIETQTAVEDHIIRELHRWDVSAGVYIVPAPIDVGRPFRLRDFLQVPDGLDVPDTPFPLWARCDEHPNARADWALDRNRLVDAAVAGKVYDWSGSLTI